MMKIQHQPLWAKDWQIAEVGEYIESYLKNTSYETRGALEQVDERVDRVTELLGKLTQILVDHKLITKAQLEDILSIYEWSPEKVIE